VTNIGRAYGNSTSVTNAIGGAPERVEHAFFATIGESAHAYLAAHEVDWTDED
jgi:hypothetical protein